MNIQPSDFGDILHSMKRKITRGRSSCWWKLADWRPLSARTVSANRATVSTRLHPSWFSVALQALDSIVEIVHTLVHQDPQKLFLLECATRLFRHLTTVRCTNVGWMNPVYCMFSLSHKEKDFLPILKNWSETGVLRILFVMCWKFSELLLATTTWTPINNALCTTSIRCKRRPAQMDNCTA